MADGDYERREGRLAEIKRLERLLKGFADTGHGQDGHARQHKAEEQDRTCQDGVSEESAGEDRR